MLYIKTKKQKNVNDVETYRKKPEKVILNAQFVHTFIHNIINNNKTMEIEKLREKTTELVQQLHNAYSEHADEVRKDNPDVDLHKIPSMFVLTSEDPTAGCVASAVMSEKDFENMLRAFLGEHPNYLRATASAGKEASRNITILSFLDLLAGAIDDEDDEGEVEDQKENEDPGQGKGE